MGDYNRLEREKSSINDTMFRVGRNIKDMKEAAEELEENPLKVAVDSPEIQTIREKIERIEELLDAAEAGARNLKADLENKPSCPNCNTECEIAVTESGTTGYLCPNCYVKTDN